MEFPEFSKIKKSLKKLSIWILIIFILYLIYIIWTSTKSIDSKLILSLPIIWFFFYFLEEKIFPEKLKRNLKHLKKPFIALGSALVFVFGIYIVISSFPNLNTENILTGIVLIIFSVGMFILEFFPKLMKKRI